MGFRTEEESPQLEPALQPRTDADENIPSCEEHSEFFARPVTESATAWAGSDTDSPSGAHSEFTDRPVTELVTARAGSDTDFPK